MTSPLTGLATVEAVPSFEIARTVPAICLGVVPLQGLSLQDWFGGYGGRGVWDVG